MGNIKYAVRTTYLPVLVKNVQYVTFSALFSYIWINMIASKYYVVWKIFFSNVGSRILKRKFLVSYILFNC